jgi:hypothetical protein
VEGPLEADPVRVASRGLRLSAARTGATLSGEARLAESSRKWATWRDDLRLALTADLRGRLEDLAARSPQGWPIAGPIIFQARLGGTPSALEGGGQVEMREFRVGPERLEAVRAALAFKGSELTVPRLTARRGSLPLQAEGAIDTQGRYRYSLLPVKLDLAALPPLAAAGARGTAVLRVKGAGKWPQLGLEGDVALTDAVFRELEVGNGSLGFALDGKQWRWDLSLALGVRARGLAPLAFSGPLQAEVTATSLDLMPLLPGLRQQLPFPLTARADGRAAVRGTLPGLRDLAGRIELAALRGQAGEVPWRTLEPARLTLEAGALRVESLDLVGPGLAVAIRGSVRPGERTDLDLSGHAPVAIVRSWVPPLADLRGTPEVRVSLAGAPGELKVAGRAELKRVDVKLGPVPIWLSITSGEVRFDNAGVQYKVREGAAAGGRLEGQGTSERLGERWRHSVDFRLDKAQVESIFEQLQIERQRAGDLFARGSLVFETGGGRPTLPTFQGRVSFTLEGGSIARAPALETMFDHVRSTEPSSRLPDLDRERLSVRQVSADFSVTDGVMETKNFLLDSESVRVSLVGKVMLDQERVDATAAVRPLQVLEQGIRRIPLLGRLLPQEQSLAIAYFRVEGPWAKPSVSVETVKSVGQTAGEILLLLLKAPARAVVPNP